MSERCGNSVNKYIVVEPAQEGVYDGLTICGGFGVITDKITGCDDTVNINGNDFFNNGNVNFYNNVEVNTIVANTQNQNTSNFQGNFVFSGNITPKLDDNSYLGTKTKRFREINTVKGEATIWDVKERVSTPRVYLGEDSEGNNRMINAENSIIRNDILLGGSY